MPQKHPNTERIGGPGASHENRQHPEKSQARNEPPAETKNSRHSGISGGGGEADSHHTHDPVGKGGQVPHTKTNKAGNHGSVSQSEYAVSQGGMNQESDHNKHNDPGQAGHKPQKHTELEEKQTR